MSRCRPLRNTRGTWHKYFSVHASKKKEGGGCVHGLLRTRVESLPFPSAFGRCSLPCPPRSCSPLRAKGRRQRGRAGRLPPAPGPGGQQLPSGGAKVQPRLQPCGRQPGRWEKLLRCCSTLGAEELFKVVICQTLMSPDRACENRDCSKGP